MIQISSPDIGIEEQNAVMEVLKSKKLCMGSVTEEFEEKLSKYLGVKHVICVNSGTSALHCAYLACGLVGQRVSTSPFSFVATFNMLKAIGCTIDYVDISEDDYNIDVDKLMDSIKPSTRGIVPISLFGHSAKLKDIKALANECNLRIVSDCCQSFGAELDGEKVSKFADATCFSGYPSKILALGESGWVATDNEQIADFIRDFRNHSLKSGNIGFNYRMTDISAAIGLEQLKKADNAIKTRRKIADRYNHAFKNLPIKLPLYRFNSVYNNYSFRLDTSFRRDYFIVNMKERGVECRVYYPKPIFPAPIATKVSETIVSIPIYPSMTSEEIDIVINSVVDTISEIAPKKK